MQIGGPIPFHAARAYGLSRAAPPARPASTARPEPIAAPRSGTPSSATMRASELVAARVPGGVDFSGAQPQPTGPVLSLYTRAADKVEAATAVMLGRALDVRG